MPCARPGMPGIPCQQRLGTVAKSPALEERGSALQSNNTEPAEEDQVAILGDAPGSGHGWPSQTAVPRKRQAACSP